MTELRSLCVYCGSSANVDQRYKDSATALGTELAKRGITLVYGGGRVGLMGLCADAVLAGGGRVVGIIPEFLERYEIGHQHVSELIIVDSMHVRKKRMEEMSDGFIVLPGGFGTLDEFFEILTWKQLGLHEKPVVIADIGGYWAPLQAMLDHIIETGFARPGMRGLWSTATDLDGVFAALGAAPAPTVSPTTKWA